MKFLLKSMPALIGMLTLTSNPSYAGQLADGTTFFDKSPRLLNALTTFTNVYVWGAKYYFIMNLPADVGEPLQTVTIRQIEGLEEIDFQLKKTFAFEGTNTNRGQALAIKEVTYDAQTQTVTVIFDPPVSPGQTFTIGLRPYQNPQYEGIYLFRVNVYPQGEKSQGLSLGVGRLQFYRGGGSAL